MGKRAVVAGGGIGGLAAGIALHRRGWQVEVRERAPEFTEIGAGISLWPNALRALDALGVGERVRRLGMAENSGGVRDRRGRWLMRTDAAALERRYGAPLVMLHRADLVKALVEALPPAYLRPVVTVTEADPDADLTVAADGIRSALRMRYWPDAPKPRYAGYTAWRAITDPMPSVREGAVVWGRGTELGYVALPDDRYYCFATAAAPAGGTDSGDELFRRFGGFPAPVPDLLAAVPAERVLRHDIEDLPTPDTFVRGRVVLLGDAAHAMTPHLGQGACQALEDAVTLAACLDDGPAEAALARYDALRRPRTAMITRRAARLGRLMMLTSPVAVAARDLAVRLTPAGMAMRSVRSMLDWDPPV